VLLAEWAAAKGAIVYVEPSGRSTPSLLGRLLALAHIVKYSADHRVLVVDARRRAGRNVDPWLEIETHGAAGLRYRVGGSKVWRTRPAFEVSEVVDTAGAGDWCSVGILHALAQGGAAAVEHVPVDVLDEAINVGQALSAWTCQYEGARGGMYHISRDEFFAAVEGTLGRQRLRGATAAPLAFGPTPARVALCHDCKDVALVG
jgi:fructokinase